jgi:outer membrane beta-barrel protein
MLLAVVSIAAPPLDAQEAPPEPDSLAVPAAADSPSVEWPALDDAAIATPAPADSTPATAAASSAPRQTVIRKVKLDKKPENVVRSGPGDRFAIVSVQPKDATFPVIAKSEDWYNIRISESETGWIHTSLCKEFDDLSDLEFRPNPKLFTRTGSYTLAAYGGAYSFDRKSNSMVLGGRLGYYIFDRLQAEAGVAWTHIVRPAEIVESLFGLTLEEEDFHMLFYHLDLIYEILPGRQMVPFASAGVGSSIMQGETEPSFNFGAGTTLFLSKRTAMRWEFRTYRFQSGPPDARFSNNNIEFTIGTVFLF